jgi:hypothetical protein
MENAVLDRIEADIDQLSLSEQLWLMERLAHRIRQHALPAAIDIESDLAAMASDPDIQRELRQIEHELQRQIWTVWMSHDDDQARRNLLCRSNPLQGREQAGPRPGLVLSVEACASH